MSDVDPNTDCDASQNSPTAASQSDSKQLPSGVTTQRVQLTLEAKEAVNQYLRNWMVALGIFNVAAIAAFGLYIFNAVNSIRDRAQHHIDASVDSIQKQAVAAAEKKVSDDKGIQETFLKALRSGIDAAGDVGRVHGRLTEIDRGLTAYQHDFNQLDQRLDAEGVRIQGVKKQIDELSLLLARVKDEDKYIRLVEAFDAFFASNPTAGEALNKIRERVDAIDKATLKSQVEAFTSLQLGTETTGADVPKAHNGEHTETFQFPGEVVATGIMTRATANPTALDELSYLQVHIDPNDKRKVHLRCRSRRANSHQSIPPGDHRIDGTVWAIYRL